MSGRRAKEQRRLAKDDIRSNAEMMKAVRERIECKLATKSFGGYLKYINRFNHEFVFGRFVEFLCEVLDDFEKGKIKKLALFVPPQHGKSTTLTETYASYFLMKNPSKRIMIASYGQDTADKFGEANLQKVVENGHLFDVSISKLTRSKTKFNLADSGGGLLSTTIRGGATGFKADLLIVDDPIKGPGDLGKKARDEVDENYRTVFKTRLSPEGQEIMIMTRWHTDDLAGRVLDDTWTIVELPALSLGADVDLLGREKGEALFPESGKTIEFLTERKKEVGEKAWQSMYMQNPVVDNGIVFKRDWIKYFDLHSFDVASCDEYYTTWDFNATSGDNSDYAVGQFWGIRNDNFYLIDMVRGQWSRKESQAKFDYFYERWGTISHKVLVEKAANGHAILDDRHYLSNLEAVIPRGDKYERIERSSVEWENGNVYLPAGDTISEILVEEAIGLKQVKNDDAIDACAQMINYVRAKRLEKKERNVLTFSGKVFKR